jgi:hypothetical protein
MTVLEYDPHERYGVKMTLLCRSFPTLTDADGIEIAAPAQRSRSGQRIA